MHRFLVPTELLEEASPVLPKDAAKHLKVLRPEPDEEFELFDGRGRWRVYRYDAASKSLTSLFGDGRSAFNVQPSTVDLTLFACVTKGSRWDWTIEKATELGVSRIVPVISDRTIVRIPAAERAAKRERWRRIAEDAARQSDAKWIPEILEPVDFSASLPLVRETVCFVGALVNPPAKMIGSEVREHRGEHIGVYVGPEGDFTPDELASLLKIAVPVSFGSTILRAETAAIFAVAAVKSFLDSEAG